MKKLLIIDDDHSVVELLISALASEDRSIRYVYDGEAALKRVAKEVYDLVICDLMLPGRSGLEALQAMRARRPRLGIVMITGHATPANEDLVLAAGATAYLPKPFDASELLTLVRHVLAQSDVAGEEQKL